MRILVRDLRRLIGEASRPDSGSFKKGDRILFGKWKTKRGKIVDIYLDDRGQVTLEIEPVPKGRKKNVEMGLYKIWHDENAD